MARFVGFYLPIKGSGSAGCLEGGVGKAGLRARLSSQSDWPVDPGGLGWIRPLGGDGGLIGRGRACWRGPRRGRSGPAVCGVTMAGSRVLEIGLLRARPTQCPSPRHLPEEPGARRLHRRRAHNDLGAKSPEQWVRHTILPKSYLASWSIPNPCPSPLQLGSSISKAGISWRHWRGPRGGRRHGTWPHVTFHQRFHQVPVLR